MSWRSGSEGNVLCDKFRLSGYDETYAHCMVVDYNIDVKKALQEHPEFEEIICPIEDIF